MIFKSEVHFNEGKNYYNLLKSYGGSKFAPNDIIKIKNILHYKEEKYFELVVFYENGESDQIDISQL